MTKEANSAPEPLAELFSSRVRAAVLALMLPRPHLAFSLTDLSRRLEIPVSSAQHECYKLTRLGLLRDERIGNARLYRPNPAWPLLPPLAALAVRALDPRDALLGAIEGVSGIDSCWVSGALDHSRGPLYLVIVGELDIEAVDGIFDRSRVVLEPWGSGRLELAYFRGRDWSARTASGDPFATTLSRDRRLDVRIAIERPSPAAI